MIATLGVPLTLEERLQQEQSVLYCPATFEQYIELLDEVEYTIEYHKDNIIALSYASQLHEEIVANLIYELQVTYRKSSMRVLGSNQRIHVESSVSNFAPDVAMARDVVRQKELGPKKTAILNPYLVVEILSEGTRKYDMGVKLPAYKTVASLEYILYLDSEQVAATLYSRDENRRWRSQDYDADFGYMPIGEATIELASLYS